MAEQLSSIEEPEVNKQLPLLVRHYLWKTGPFEPKKGEFSGWSAQDIMTNLDSDDRFPQNIKDHFNLLIKKESAEIKQGKGPVGRIV